MPHSSAIVTGDAFERALGIPADELVSAPINTRVDGIPVVVIPVTVTAVEVDHHVVDEVGHVDIRGEGIVSGLIGNATLGDGVSLKPVGGGAVDDISRVGIQGVPAVLFAPVVGRAEVGIGSFDDIVNSPVKSVEVEVEKGSVAGSVSHCEL